MKKILFLLSIIFWSSVSLCHATTTPVVINEIAAYEPSDSEWLEIFNRSAEPVDLTGWKFWENNTNHGLILWQGQDLILAPEEYAIIANNGAQFNSAHPEFSGKIINSAWSSLLESGELIGLKTSTDPADLVESFTYLPAANFSLERSNPYLDDYSSVNWWEHASGSTPGQQNSNYFSLPISTSSEINWPPVAVAGPDQEIYLGESVYLDASYSTDSDGLINDYFWDFGDGEFAITATTSHLYASSSDYLVNLIITDNQGATGSDDLLIKVKIFLPPVVIKPSDVLINELMVNPSEGNEWLELFNNTSTAINLTGWSINDGSGKIFDLNGEILPQGFLVLDLTSSKLNNDGDAVILKNEQGLVIDQMAYGDWDNNTGSNAPLPQSGQALARLVGQSDTDNNQQDFFVTVTPTKGLVNNITAPVQINSGSTGGNQSVNISNNQTLTVSSQINSYSPLSPASLVINELMIDPSSGDNEWVELYNNTENSIDLNGWQIKDGAGSVTNLIGAILARSFFIIDSPKGSLNNSGDQIDLFDPLSRLIDQIIYGDWPNSLENNAPLAKDGWSLARIKDGLDTDNYFQDFKETSSTTKNSPNLISEAPEKIVFPTATPNTAIEESAISTSATQIFLSEILPNPAGSDLTEEFIELYNPNDFSVDLSGWQIDDGEGGSRPYLIKEKTIAAKSCLVFKRSETKLALNNSFDEVRLFNNKSELVDQMSYEQAPEDLAYAFDFESEEWQWTDQITAGQENIFNLSTDSANSPEDEFIFVPLAEIRNLDLGAKVKTSGIVAAAPGTFAGNFFYLNGLQIYSAQKDFPSLKIGDEIEARGILAESQKEFRLKIKEAIDINILNTDQELKPREIALGELNEDCEGQLIKISGEIIELKGSSIYLADNSGEVEVYLKRNTGLKKTGLKVGDFLTVIGIVSQNNGLFQLWPRLPEDLIKGEVKGEMATSSEFVETKASGFKFWWLIVFVVGGAGLAGWKYREKIEEMIKKERRQE